MLLTTLVAFLVIILIVTLPLRMLSRDLSSLAKGIDALAEPLKRRAALVEAGMEKPLAVRFWNWLKVKLQQCQ